MRSIPSTALLAALISSCAVEPELTVPDDLIDPGKGDGVASPSPHFQAMSACDDAFAAQPMTSETLSTYWTCLLTANTKAAATLDRILDNNVPGEYESIERDFDEMCAAAGLRSTAPDAVAMICHPSLTRQLGSLFDAFAKFGTFDRVANAPDRMFTASCYEAYSAAIVKASSDVQQAEISEELRDCVTSTIDQVMTEKLEPGLLAAGSSQSEVDSVGAAFQHLEISAGSICSSFGESLAPPPVGTLAFRLSVKARCAADMLNSALVTLVFFHDRFADRVPSRLEFAVTPNQDIPDGADRGIDVAIPVTGVTAPKTLKVALDISHSFPADLVVELYKDGRLVRRLLDHDEDTPFPLRTSYSFTAAEVGDQPNGTWTLRVADVWEDDTGKINSVSLSFE